jgi:hypothetical protein
VAAISDAITQYHENLKTLRKKSSSRHSLQFARKRKLLKDSNRLPSEESPLKKMKTTHLLEQEEERGNQHSERGEMLNLCQVEVNTQKTNCLQSIKALLTTFGDGIRRYMFPGPSSMT